MSKNSVKSGIKELEVHGFLRIERESGKPNRYRLNLNLTGQAGLSGKAGLSGPGKQACPDQASRLVPKTITKTESKTESVRTPKRAKPEDPIPEVIPALELLEGHIHDITPDKKFKNGWRKREGRALRLLRTADGIPIETQCKVLKWLRTGKDRDAIFWRKNILSAEKFRIQFTRLEAARQAVDRASGNATVIRSAKCPSCGKISDMPPSWPKIPHICSRCGKEIGSIQYNQRTVS